MSESFVEISPRISDPHMRDMPVREMPLDVPEPRAAPGMGRPIMIGVLVVGIIVLLIILTYQIYIHFSTKEPLPPPPPAAPAPAKGSMLPPKLRDLDDAAFKQFIAKTPPAAPAAKGGAAESEMEKKDLEFISNIVRATPEARAPEPRLDDSIPTREEITAAEIEAQRAEAAEAAEPMITETDDSAPGAALPCDYVPRSGKNAGRQCGKVSGSTPGRCTQHARL